MILHLNDYSGADAMAQFAAALDDARKHPGSTIVVPPGTYILTSELARRTRDEAISGVYGENPEGCMFRSDFPHTVGLSFEGHRGTVLQARGATLMIDGFMEPIRLKNCEDVRIEGLTIDHLRRPYSRGTIVAYAVESAAARTGHIVVRFDPAYPVDERTIAPRSCAYDSAAGQFNADMRIIGRRWLGDQCVRYSVKNMPARSLQGEHFYIWHSFHYRPAILIEDAKRITLADITLHSQPGMGVVGHRSEDVLLDCLRVIPAPGEHLSTNTDATHFASCRGELVFRNCTFDGHGDDATNVHTYYHDLKRLSADTFTGSVSVPTHAASLDYPDPGDLLELVEQDSLTPIRTYRVLSVDADQANMRYAARLDGPLPEDAEDRCWLCNISQLPRLTFSGCTTANHWARAVLIKTRSALVENCTFTGSMLQAIHVAAEGWWREGAACENVVIRNNRFICCGLSGHARVGGVQVEMAVDKRCGTPQRHLSIVDNHFDLPGVPLAIHVSNAEDVRIAGNTFSGMRDPIEIVNCENIDIQQD